MNQQRLGSKNILHLIKSGIIAALAFGAAIVLFACEGEVEKIEAFKTPEDLPSIYAENFENTFIDSFKIQSYMKAPVLQQFKSNKQSFLEFPEGVLLIKYNTEGKEISRIKADYARNYDKEERWEAKNNVIAINEQGDTLKTEFLIWDEKKDKIYSDKFVKIIRADQIITGIGFEAGQNMQNWKIKNPKGSIYVTVNEGEQNTGKDVSSTKSENELQPVIIDN